MLQINVSTVAVIVIAAVFTFLGSLGWKTVKSVDNLIFELGTIQPPRGILGRLDLLEKEVKSIRDWMIHKGYERREHAD